MYWNIIMVDARLVCISHNSILCFQKVWMCSIAFSCRQLCSGVHHQYVSNMSMYGIQFAIQSMTRSLPRCQPCVRFYFFGLCRVPFSPPCLHIVHKWRFQFLDEQLLPVLDLVVKPKQPDYLDILKRDAAIRDFELPPPLRIVDNDGVPPPHPIGMQQVWSAFTTELGQLCGCAGFEKRTLITAG